MAPQNGGTELPDAKTSALIFVVASAGFYAWFIDPPKRAEEKKAASEAAKLVFEPGSEMKNRASS